MTDDDGLVRAYLLDGAGVGRPLQWPEVHRWAPEDGLLWIHLDRANETARRWLATESGLGQLACEALLAEDTRPRSAELMNALDKINTTMGRGTVRLARVPASGNWAMKQQLKSPGYTCRWDELPQVR